MKKIFNELCLFLAAIDFLITAKARRFAAKIPNRPSILYFPLMIAAFIRLFFLGSLLFLIVWVAIPQTTLTFLPLPAIKLWEMILTIMLAALLYHVSTRTEQNIGDRYGASW